MHMSISIIDSLFILLLFAGIALLVHGIKDIRNRHNMHYIPLGIGLIIGALPSLWNMIARVANISMVSQPLQITAYIFMIAGIVLAFYMNRKVKRADRYSIEYNRRLSEQDPYRDL